MARLLVFRGETPNRELELERLPFRIGRGPTNDLVLEDKSVSRDHAEIRIEGGRFVLADRQSENGIWVAGNRVPTIGFDAATIASIGPFRLRVEGAPDADALVNEPTVAGTARVDPPPPLPTPTPQPRTARVPTTGPFAQRVSIATAFVRRMSAQRKWTLGAAALLVALAALVGTTVYVRSARRTDQAARQMAAWIAAANVQVTQGACADALTQNIQPGLARDPNNVDLLNLKQRAEACPDPIPTTEPPPTDPTTLALISAATLIELGQCEAALNEHINKVLLEEPDNAEAQDLKARALKCSSPTVLTTSVLKLPPPPVVPVAPENGGLDLLPGENAVDYQNRIKAMRLRYDDAVSAAAGGPSTRVIRAFEGIVREAGTRYLDANARLTDARNALRAKALGLQAEARELEKKRSWNEALEKYKQANEVDPSLSIDADVSRINQAKLEAGEQACSSARQQASYNPPLAQDLFRQVLTLLPPEHPCYLIAKTSLGIR